MTDARTLAELLRAHPDVDRIEAFVCDVNGVARGKWLPRDKAEVISRGAFPMPCSVFALDIWGADVPDAKLAFGTGDPDGLCREIVGSAALVPWAKRPTAQVMLTMTDKAGITFYADPRGVLTRVVDRLRDAGLFAVVAVELEFYLAEGLIDRPVPPGTAGLRWAADHGQVLGLDALRQHEQFFDELDSACQLQGLPVETMLRENGAGQYEVNLRHNAEPLVAADHAILLKRAVRHVARRNGLRATFMAKPYGDRSGSGMHVHCSLTDSYGSPLMAEADGRPSTLLWHAVAGLVATLPDLMLALAPHANSYRRFRLNSHAPMLADWGADDRSAAVRVISGSPAATRVEQRVAGADANPCLVVASVLSGIGEGLSKAVLPPAAGSPGATPLPREWGTAIDAFAGSAVVSSWFGERFRDLFVACKRQDYDGFLSRVSDVELQAYMEVV